jgi:hypothetical protein
MVLTQAVALILSGKYISRTKRYGEIIVLGFILFCVGVSLTALFSKDFPVCYVVGILIILGYGNVFQPTIVTLQAHARKSQRVLVISVRNFLRCLRGAIGLAVSVAVLQNVLKASLPGQFEYLATSIYVKQGYARFNSQDAEAIIEACSKASRGVFILYVAVCGHLFIDMCLCQRSGIGEA